MVISSSPARSNDHAFSAATRSTTSTGFTCRTSVCSVRDMPPPGWGDATQLQAAILENMPNGGSRDRTRPGPNHWRDPLYPLRRPGPKRQAGFIKDSQILEIRLRRGPAAGPGPSVEQAGDRFFRRRASDRFADQRGDRQHADVARDAHRFGRLDRIRDDELVELRGGEPR